MPEHVVAGAPFPDDHPRGYFLDANQEPVFDPAIHLDLQAPAWIKPVFSSFTETHGDHPVAYPLPVNPSPSGTAESLGPGGGQVPYPGLAFTSSFKVLSAEGVRVMRECIARNEKYAHSNERQAKCIRGLGYRSKFIRDFAYCPQVLEHLSKCSGVPVYPHDMCMNIAQINFGKIGDPRPVDRWHLDSVPFVMVLLLSDATDMVGGKLKVARLPDPQEALRQVLNEELDPEAIELVNYPAAGHAIFMQGCQIAHTVTPVEAAREPRITLVNSYQSLNPFAKINTCYKTFKLVDPADAAPTEVGRHYAWRVQGQLDYLIKNGLFETGNSQVLSILDNAVAELKRVRDFVSGDDIDEAPYKVKTESEAYKDMINKRKTEFEEGLRDQKASSADIKKQTQHHMSKL